MTHLADLSNRLVSIALYMACFAREACERLNRHLIRFPRLPALKEPRHKGINGQKQQTRSKGMGWAEKEKDHTTPREKRTGTPCSLTTSSALQEQRKTCKRDPARFTYTLSWQGVTACPRTFLFNSLPPACCLASSLRQSTQANNKESTFNLFNLIHQHTIPNPISNTLLH